MWRGEPCGRSAGKRRASHPEFAATISRANGSEVMKSRLPTRIPGVEQIPRSGIASLIEAHDRILSW